MSWEWAGRTVLVTGATGSFGQHCLRRLLEMPVAAIRALSRDEYKQAQAQAEITDPRDRVRWLLGDVRDRDRLMRACEGADVVIHAAALKRIDAGCNEPRELMLTNVIGTQNAVDAAIDCGVQRFVFLSSDKGCAPINAYGASKAMAEHLVRRGNVHAGGKTLLACTRYGNVLGSRGSVLEVWRRAVFKWQPLPITQPQMTRFWLTLDQAVDCVLAAVERMQGGEVFIPPMLRARVQQLAAAFAPHWERIVTDLRPGGERLHELVIAPDEGRMAYEMEGGTLVLYPEITEWAADYERRGRPVSMPIWSMGLASKGAPLASVEQLRELIGTAP